MKRARLTIHLRFIEPGLSESMALSLLWWIVCGPDFQFKRNLYTGTAMLYEGERASLQRMRDVLGKGTWDDELCRLHLADERVKGALEVMAGERIGGFEPNMRSFLNKIESVQIENI